MSSDRQLNYVNDLQNRDQKLYYVDDASELNSINLEENDKIYAINDNKLFQMEIADQEEELSGSIVSFNGRNNTKIKSLVANIEPVQDLHGYDNPWPGGGSKNKLKVTAETQTINGVTFTVNADSSVSLSGTSTGTFTFTVGTFATDENSYILNGCPSGGGGSRYLLRYIADTTYSDTGSGVNLPLNQSGTVVIYIVSGQNMTGKVFYPMIRLATETDATFAPYSNICPISGWTGANIYQAGLPKGYTYVNYITVNNAINIPTDIDFNAHDIEVICVHQPLVYKQYGAIYSAAYKGETYNVTRLILNVNIGTYLFNNASRANAPGSFSEPDSSFIKTINRFGSIDINNRTVPGSTLSGSNTNVTNFVVGGVNMSVRYKYIIVKKTDASSGQRLLVLVACRNANGIAGLYDLVNGAFWTTASSSDITATGDAPSDLSMLYNVTFPINWGSEAGTVYGGTVTLNEDGSVDLYDTYAKRPISWSNFSWRFFEPNLSGTGYVASTAELGIIQYEPTTEVYSEIFKTIYVPTSHDVSNFVLYEMCMKGSRISICTPYNNAADLIANLGNIDIIFKTTQSTSYHFDSIGQLHIFFGTNNIWSDIGDITVKIAGKGITAFELAPHT